MSPDPTHVVVILGHVLSYDGTPSHDLTGRVGRAVRLTKRLLSQRQKVVLIFSGGRTPACPDIDEAAVIDRLFIEAWGNSPLRIPERILETKSRHTLGNAQHSVAHAAKKMIHGQMWISTGNVWHAIRAGIHFQAQLEHFELRFQLRFVHGGGYANLRLLFEELPKIRKAHKFPFGYEKHPSGKFVPLRPEST